MESKVCTKCKEEKPLENFDWRSKAKGRRQSICKSCTSEYHKQRRPALRQKLNAYASEYRAQNRENAKEASRKWRQENKGKATANARNYRAKKMQRTASWANEQLIAAYYTEAKRLEELTGIKFHVDHIIPLQGELVSGLHVETNLQLLPAHENRDKSNSFDPELFVA